ARISGFTAAAQAADCRADGTPLGFCEDSLRNNNEKISFKDITPPSLTINGANPMTLELNVDTYEELGATAIDNVDGDISASVEIGGDFVDTSTVTDPPGYSVIYNIIDSSGNFADSETRFVNVVDTIAPVITLNGDAVVTLEVGVDTYSELGAAVSDDGVPTLTEATISGDPVDTNTVGTYIVRYNATDGFNTATEVTRTVNVVDTIAPVIILLGTTPISVEAGTTYADDGATASDVGDGDVTGFITTANPVNTAVLGEYTVTYNVMDAAGNPATEVSRSVTVRDTTRPVIVVKDGATIIVFTADDPRGAYVDLSGIVTASDLGQPIGVSCATTTGVGLPAWLLPGDYVVICTASDGQTVEVTVSIIIDINDTEAPVLTVPQMAVTAVADPITGTAVVDYSSAVSATDNVDVDVTIDCIPSSGSAFAVGNTTVTCTATDDGPNTGGNANSATATFTVTITDATPPVITVPSSPVIITLPVVLPNGEESFEYDYGTLVSVSDASDPSPTLMCRTDPLDKYGSAFIGLFEFGDTTISCIAEDFSGNSASADFVISAPFIYDIKVDPPKGRARTGSTVPLDWQYLDRNSGAPVDSSNIMVEVRWAKMTDSTCLVRDLSSPEGTSGLGDDSGNSDFRYSASSDTWQFSWQTPEIPGHHKVSIHPPGGNVANAWKCINLR
ncbi:MAG: DUF5011 domain-containing protein, partial [Gammaproteobacteria bacterium]|nr:DUF5011 domain-containing protein [Gammaproteobacteria bacterium]